MIIIDYDKREDPVFLENDTYRAHVDPESRAVQSEKEHLSGTKELAEICRQADILVAAVGKAKFVTADMVKEDAVVIDVGMNRNEAGKLCGDVDFEAVEPKASLITPVPGGVGPMTRAVLMKNTVKAAKIQNVAK